MSQQCVTMGAEKGKGKRQGGEREMQAGEGKGRCFWCPEQLQAAATSADQGVQSKQNY